MSKTGSRTGTMLVPAAVVLALLLTGCSDDTSPDKPGPTGSTPSATGTATATPTPATTAPPTAPATTAAPKTTASPTTTPSPPRSTPPAAPNPPTGNGGSGATAGTTTGNGTSSSGTAGDNPVYYKNCTAVRAAGAAPIHRGEPGYGSHLDRDGDGTACE